MLQFIDVCVRLPYPAVRNDHVGLATPAVAIRRVGVPHLFSTHTFDKETCKTRGAPEKCIVRSLDNVNIMPQGTYDTIVIARRCRE